MAKRVDIEQDDYSGKLTKRMKLEIQRAQLENERSSFLAHWRDLGDNILPRRPRFFTTDNNQGYTRNQKIIDSTATLAARTLKAGMMGGLTSPARPWFNLTTPDPDMADIGEVKDWLYEVNRRMSDVFVKSNLYNALPIVYGDMGVFGTSAMLIEEDFDDVIRCYVFGPGSYCIGLNEKLQVNVFRRDFQMTVRQLIDKFGYDSPQDKAKGIIQWDRFSTIVRSYFLKRQLDTKIDVCHSILPNEEYDPSSPLAKHKLFADIYYERGVSTIEQSFWNGPDAERFLRESGHDYFPVLAPRWEVNGEDVYGTSCPGMDCLGDIKALQMMHRRKSQAVEKMINPPMAAPTSLKSGKASILPGDITYVDTRDGQQGFKPVHEVRFNLEDLKEDIQQHQSRIQRGFFEDLFLMMSQSDRREITAREVDERHEEKLLALGPVLEQTNQDLLDPLIDITFSLMLQQRKIPRPPKALQGIPLKVEYVSIMAQAQKLIGLASSDRFGTFLTEVAQMAPNALDVVNLDEYVKDYGDRTSQAPKIIRTDEQIAAIRQQKQKAQQQQMQMQQMQQASQAAKNASQANLNGDNALTRIIQQGQAGNLMPQK